MQSTDTEILEDDAPALPLDDDDAPALALDEPIIEEETPVAVEIGSQINMFDPLASGEKLAKESMVLELHIHAPGWDRSIDPESIMDKNLTAATNGEQVDEVEVAGETTNKKVNPRRIRATKEIIDKKELKKLHSFINVTVNKIKEQRCLATNLLAPGMYVLPLRMVNEVDQIIESLRAGIQSHLDQIEPRYEAIIEQARKDLGPQFKESDYMTFDQVRASYAVTSRYLSLNVPAALASVNKRLFEEAVAKSKQDSAEMAQVIRDGMRGGFLKLVTHFTEVLGHDEEGKPKIIRASTAEKLKDFCRTFEDRDLTGDMDLAVAARQVHDLIDGVDPKAIRSNEALRDALQAKFAQIVEKATAMVETRERKLALDMEV